MQLLKIDTKVYGDPFGRGSQDVRVVMTVKSVDGGWVAWGSVPASCLQVETPEGRRDLAKGDKVELTASFEPKQDDPKFAFFKRPCGRVVS